MAVVGYQCSVCKRTINLIQNKVGLDWIGNCNITLGCRGQLIQQELYLDYTRGSLPDNVVGLKNWTQRQILYNFTQTVDRQNWVITHNLGTLPSVQIYVNVPLSADPTNMVEILPTEIIYNSDDQLTLILPRAYTGIAQLIARASNPDILNPRPRPAVTSVAPTIQLTNAGLLSIATRISTVGSIAELPIDLEFTPSTGTTINVGYIATNVAADTSPWADTSRVMIKGKVYTVRTFNIQTGSGEISNGSSVALTGINPGGPLTLSVDSVNLSNNAFVVIGDYSLYFTAGSQFNIEGTHTVYDETWTVLQSSYDPATLVTSIVPTGTIPSMFPLPASIIQSGTRQIIADEVIILLGSSPFTIYDKLVTSYVDFISVNTTATQFDLFYNAGDMFANTSIQQVTYPPIRSV